jgi:hypothetical protein
LSRIIDTPRRLIEGGAVVAGDLSVMFGKLAAQKVDKSGYIIAVSSTGVLVLSPRAELNGRATLSSLANSSHNP